MLSRTLRRSNENFTEQMVSMPSKMNCYPDLTPYIPGPIRKCLPTEWTQLQKSFFETAEALDIPRNPDTVGSSSLKGFYARRHLMLRMAGTTLEL